MPSLISGYEYDIFISYRQKDNKYDGWVTEFVENLKKELEATFKEEISVYFDINPHDGLLETHDVDESLKEKLKCLIFRPIISRTYCDPKSFAWENEFKAFVEQASKDQFGLKVKIPNGNVASRVLPVQIYDLDKNDTELFESVTGGVLRSIEFIYKSAGVNRPLRAKEDHPQDNVNNTYYRDQINKIANAVKDIISAIESTGRQEIESGGMSQAEQIILKRNHKTRYIIIISAILILVLLGLLVIPKLRKPSDGKVKSIAVLPFFNDSPDEENEYFINGIMDEVLNNLQAIKDLSVVSRTSVEQYRGSDKPPIPEIARKLNVNYIVEGSGQKYGNNFRLRVQLIDGNKDKHLWADSYERNIQETKDIFLIQTTIAEAIATELEAAITPEEKQQIGKTTEANLEAYDAYLKGLFFYERGGDAGEDNNRAIEAFRESIRLDSTFALPWTYLSMCHWRKATSTNSPEFKEAKRTAEKALELDPASGVAIVNVAEILDNEYDFAAADEKIRLALKIDPDDQYVLRNAGRFYTKMGKTDESIAYCKKALQKNPNNRTVLNYLTVAFFYAGQLEEAMENFLKYKEIGYSGRDFYYKILLEQGNFSRIINEPPSEETVYVHDIFLAAAHFALGQTNQGEELINKVVEENTPSPYWIAFAYAYADNPGKVNEWLEKSFDRREKYDLTYLGVEPAFKKYRDLPAVKKILAQIKYPEQ
jgi:TolB-like protein